MSAAAGVLYLLALPSVEPLFGPVTGGARGGAWDFVLAVVFAPPVAGVLCRGLVYAGIGRSVGPRAVVLSAPIFTLVHPAVSAPPVFVLGLATAWALRCSGQLLAPMLVHAAYDAAVLLAQ